jgi:hypothetical protein
MGTTWAGKASDAPGVEEVKRANDTSKPSKGRVSVGATPRAWIDTAGDGRAAKAPEATWTAGSTGAAETTLAGTIDVQKAPVSGASWDSATNVHKAGGSKGTLASASKGAKARVSAASLEKEYKGVGTAASKAVLDEASNGKVTGGSKAQRDGDGDGAKTKWDGNTNTAPDAKADSNRWPSDAGAIAGTVGAVGLGTPMDATAADTSNSTSGAVPTGMSKADFGGTAAAKGMKRSWKASVTAASGRTEATTTPTSPKGRTGADTTPTVEAGKARDGNGSIPFDGRWTAAPITASEATFDGTKEGIDTVVSDTSMGNTKDDKGVGARGNTGAAPNTNASTTPFPAKRGAIAGARSSGALGKTGDGPAWDAPSCASGAGTAGLPKATKAGAGGGNATERTG